MSNGLQVEETGDSDWCASVVAVGTRARVNALEENLAGNGYMTCALGYGWRECTLKIA